MEIIVGLVALIAALWQLKLQRDEIRLNGKINSLIHISSMLKDKIDRNEKIVKDLKKQNATWGPLANRINVELVPMLENINNELLSAISAQKSTMDIKAVKHALRIEKD